MTEDILGLMERGRLHKRNGDKCKEEKENHLNKRCTEIEDLLEKRNPQKIHNLVKDVTKRKTCNASICIQARDGTIIMEKVYSKGVGGIYW